LFQIFIKTTKMNSVNVINQLISASKNLTIKCMRIECERHLLFKLYWENLDILYFSVYYSHGLCVLKIYSSDDVSELYDIEFASTKDDSQIPLLVTKLINSIMR